MQCVGQFSEKRIRASLSPQTTMRQAKEEFGKDMDQTIVTDENNFRFSEKDLEKPLWQFSNKCSLALSFQYDTHTEALSKKTATIKEATSNLIWGPPKLWYLALL